jgi:hypothetical protein
MAEPNFLLEFEIVAFDPLSHLRQINQALERCRRAVWKASSGPARFRRPAIRSAATLSAGSFRK